MDCQYTESHLKCDPADSGLESHLISEDLGLDCDSASVSECNKIACGVSVKLRALPLPATSCSATSAAAESPALILYLSAEGRHTQFRGLACECGDT